MNALSRISQFPGNAQRRLLHGGDIETLDPVKFEPAVGTGDVDAGRYAPGIVAYGDSDTGPAGLMEATRKHITSVPRLMDTCLECLKIGRRVFRQGRHALFLAKCLEFFVRKYAEKTPPDAGCVGRCPCTSRQIADKSGACLMAAQIENIMPLQRTEMCTDANIIAQFGKMQSCNRSDRLLIEIGKTEIQDAGTQRISMFLLALLQKGHLMQRVYQPKSRGTADTKLLGDLRQGHRLIGVAKDCQNAQTAAQARDKIDGMIGRLVHFRFAYPKVDLPLFYMQNTCYATEG